MSERSGVREISLETALDENPVGFFQYRLLIMCGFAFMADALEVNLLTFIATCAGNDWGLSDAQEASITSVVFVGIILGTMFFGMFADKYGRKVTYFVACGLIVSGGFLSGASPSYGWLVFFRSIAGFGIGGANVPFDLLAEFLPASHRGKFLIYIEYFWTIGSMLVAGVAWGTLSQQGWRFLAYMTALPVLLASVISYFYLPESPRWLLIKGRVTEAEDVIRAAAKVNGIEMTPFRLKPVMEMQETIKDANYLDLLRDKEAMRTSIPLWTVWMMFGFTYYGLILFVGRLYSTGSDDDKDDGGSCSFDYSAIFINSASEVVGVTLGALLIDNLGRVRSQTSFYLLAALSAFLMGFETKTVFVMVVGITGRIGAIAASVRGVCTFKLRAILNELSSFMCPLACRMLPG
jgi:MFS family permease